MQKKNKKLSPQKERKKEIYLAKVFIYSSRFNKSASSGGGSIFVPLPSSYYVCVYDVFGYIISLDFVVIVCNVLLCP